MPTTEELRTRVYGDAAPPVPMTYNGEYLRGALQPSAVHGTVQQEFLRGILREWSTGGWSPPTLAVGSIIGGIVAVVAILAIMGWMIQGQSNVAPPAQPTPAAQTVEDFRALNPDLFINQGEDENDTSGNKTSE